MNICIHPAEHPEELSRLLLALLVRTALPELRKLSGNAPEPRPGCTGGDT